LPGNNFKPSILSKFIHFFVGGHIAFKGNRVLAGLACRVLLPAFCEVWFDGLKMEGAANLCRPGSILSDCSKLTLF